VQRKDGFYEFLTPEGMKETGLDERYRMVTFDRATAIRNSQAEFLALGHPFIDAMLRRVGDYSFGGHTTARLIRANGFDLAAPKAGYQFNFTVRSRVQRDDGDEYLFDLHTFVVLADGTIDARMAEIAARQFSEQGDPPATASSTLHQLESLDLDNAYQLAKAALEKQAEFWDWDEDVELIGVAKVVALPSE
jgi:hypothetical protein